MGILKKNILSLIALLLGGISLFCYSQEHVILGLSLTLLASFTAIKEFPDQAGIFQFTTGALLFLLLGIELDLLTELSFPIYTLTMALAVPPPYLRNVSITVPWMGFRSNVWIELFFTITSLAAYIIANLFAPIGWMGWTFPLPCLLFSTIIGSITGLLPKGPYERFGRKEGLLEEGESVPDLELKDQNGTLVKLSDELKESNVLLFFMRAEWCPACKVLLRTYEKHKEKFKENNVTILAVSPGSVEENRSMVQRLGVDYKLLSDEFLEGAKAFRIHVEKEEWPMQNPGEQLPPTVPSSFLIDQDMLVRHIARPDRANAYIRPESIVPALEGVGQNR